jgi:hypothetical protein
MSACYARVAVAAVATVCLTSSAFASCGSAFCNVNTNWVASLPPSGPGTRVDLHFEYINQDQPRAGNKDIAIGQIPQHHDEVKTINRNTILRIDHNFDENWGMTVRLPLINREHEHIHNHRGAKLLESWDFTRLGDIVVAGRYQIQAEHPANVYGVTWGVKLPTGSIQANNGQGQPAERSLQPGTGTTDAVISAFWNDTLPIPDSGWFTQLVGDVPFNSKAGYRPGNQLFFDIGYTYHPLDKLVLSLQLNMRIKGRDSGPEAEPNDSGGRFVALSPGVSYAVLDNTHLYGYVQVPIYQYVNGVQLTAKWAGLVGISTNF